MDKLELEKRTKRFALRVIKFIASLPRGKAAEIIVAQLVDAATSIGANYREANRAESRKDFIHKIALVEKESAETQYWLELCEEGLFGDPLECRELLVEATELLAIFTAIGKTAKSRTR